MCCKTYVQSNLIQLQDFNTTRYIYIYLLTNTDGLFLAYGKQEVNISVLN